MIESMTSALIGRVVGGYTEHLTAIGRAPGTVRLRTHHVRRCFTELGISPWQATTTDLEHWLAAHDWNAASRRSAVASLRDFYRWAQREGHDNPAALLVAPPEPAPCSRPCPDAAVDHALACESGVRWWLVRLAASTGLRRAELAVVHSSDAADGWLTVHGKGNKIRRVPLPADVSAWLSTCHGYAFPGRSGGHVSVDWVHDVISQATGYPPHRLRHRYANRVYAGSHDVRAVQALLGHASLATTQRYLGLDDDQLTRAAAWAA